VAAFNVYPCWVGTFGPLSAEAVGRNVAYLPRSFGRFAWAAASRTRAGGLAERPQGDGQQVLGPACEQDLAPQNAVIGAGGADQVPGVLVKAWTAWAMTPESAPTSKAGPHLKTSAGPIEVPRSRRHRSRLTRQCGANAPASWPRHSGWFKHADPKKSLHAMTSPWRHSGLGTLLGQALPRIAL